MTKSSDKKDGKTSLLQITWSLIAAFCGVQNDANLDRDEAEIEKNGFLPYIIIGVSLTLLFVLAIFLTVKLILSAAS